jgi:predicted ATPase
MPNRKKGLRFTHVNLKNWRNFIEAEADLPPRVFLVGPNASGKSNFLDVFRFLRDIVDIGGGFQEAVRRRGGVSKLRCLAARRESIIEISVSIGHSGKQAPWEYQLAFSQDHQRRPKVEREKVIKKGAVILERPSREDKADPVRLTQTYLKQGSEKFWKCSRLRCRN